MVGDRKRRGASPWRWTARVLLTLVAMPALLVGVLVYPAPFFPHEQRIDGLRVYSDRVPSLDVQKLVKDVAHRLAATETKPGTKSRTYKVYLCHSTRRYGFFALMTRGSSSSQAIGLSVPGNIYVSMSRLEELAQEGEVFVHSRFEGRPAFAVVHEIVHFGIIDSLGWAASRSLPTWKSEGWADYQADLAGIRRDPSHDLAQRIDLLDVPGYWLDRRVRSRSFYAWQLMVEYLAEVRGYSLEDLARPSVTEAETWAQMRSWRRGRP